MSFAELDPFDLPEWLAGPDVVWRSDEGLRTGHLVSGSFHDEGGDQLSCALLAVDEAYPAPVAPDDIRSRAHQAWHHGQVLLLEHDGSPTLAVPGRRFDPDLVLEAVARFARSVGASPDHYTVLLRIGRSRG